MARVTFEVEAAEQYARLPARIKSRFVSIITRLEKWPEVSGAKPLKGKLAGRYRIRTGDYRLQFRVQGAEIIIERAGHRDGFYKE
jgi:mRNA-degrading endonuclease RelE of RelBE toxin-antitoxin system